MCKIKLYILYLCVFPSTRFTLYPEELRVKSVLRELPNAILETIRDKLRNPTPYIGTVLNTIQ